MISILLVDDQNLVQQGIKSLLDQSSEFKVIGTVTDGRSAVKQIDALRPDVVLLDIEMPGMNGITTTKYISHLSPKTKVIILSSHEDKKYVTQALMAGAKAYILKSSLMTDLKQSIIAVNNGYSQIESRLLAKIFDPSNIKLRSKKSTTEERKARQTSVKEERSEAAKTIPVIAKEESLTLQTTASTVKESKVVVSAQPSVPFAPMKELSKVDLADLEAEENHAKSSQNNQSDFVELNQVNIANSKLLTVVPKINLSEFEPLDYDELHINSPTSSEYSAVGKSSNVINPFLPAIIVKRSAVGISKSEQNNLWNKSLALVSSGASRVRQIANQPQFSRTRSQIIYLCRAIATQCQLMIRSGKVSLTQYWSQLSPVIKRWHRKGWLANAGLTLLGIITVFIIQRVFS